jgi:hypothetical protein
MFVEERINSMISTCRIQTTVILLCTGFILISSSISLAKEGGPGIRAGISINPEQFHFGGHFETEPLIDRLSFRPNFEVGTGSDLTAVTLNFEFAYHIPINNKPWWIYVGAGPALNIFRYDDDRPGSGRNGTDAEGGFNILLGVEHRDGLFGELKVGALDSPDLKFTVGYTFR